MKKVGVPVEMVGEEGVRDFNRGSRVSTLLDPV